MMRKTPLLAACLLSAAALAAPPEPKAHFGFTPGDDSKLAGYQEIISYFEKLARSSDRIKLVAFGKSALGKPMYVAFLSAPENLARLEHYREINRRMALGEADPEQARRLAVEGKAVVWIDSGLHASEVAPVQHAPHLAYHLITDESEETRRIRQNVILMQIPVINPDGLDWIVEWYRLNAGTPYELAPLPRLYQKYAGHDNNRDWFMMNLEETRHVSRLLFEQWFPHIVYNQHQSPPFPARIFVPPYAEPLNPNIPAPVMEGIHLIGAAMKERFARENKPGVLSYWGFDAWWNGGLRSVPAFHNMHGILTETASAGYAAPRDYKLEELPERFANGIPTREPSVFYQRPWLGGRWSLRDAIDYMLTADLAILDLAASRPTYFLMKSWETARANIELGRKGRPFAYVVPAAQWDPYSAIEMLRRLRWGGIRIARAKAAFEAGGKTYPAGSFVLQAAQAFRPYLVDLMEPQKYPEIRAGQSGPTKRPYDIAGWTLPLMMGVAVERIDEPFTADLDDHPDLSLPEPVLNHRDLSSFLKTIALLEKGDRVRWSADGTILTADPSASNGFDSAAYELRTPRVGLYEPSLANMDTGWTQWLLDAFRVPYNILGNDDIRKGGLRSRFDSIVFASQTAESILHGARYGERIGARTTGAEGLMPVLQRPEYTGGIGLAGLVALEEFVRAGGVLIALDAATELPVQFFPLPLAPRLRTPSEGEAQGAGGAWWCPGSLIRVTVDTAHPLAFGMPSETIVFSTGGQAWDIRLLPEFNQGDREIRAVAHYAKSSLLASGWVSGERHVLGKPILVHARWGQGQVVLFGFRPQFRGQTFGTFKFLLNAIYLASARKL